MTDEPEILQWKERKVYRCRLCAFDSLDREKFEDHFAKAHAPFRVIEGGKADEPEVPVSTEENEEGQE